MLEIERRWRESKISRSMAAPIGMKRDGELFYLDIHENIMDVMAWLRE